MEDRKYIVVKWHGELVSLLFHGSRLMLAHAEDAGDGENLLGNIYVARVRNVVKDLHAAFVEIAPGQGCFLDLRDADEPLLLNRNYDGRLLAEDEVIVQVNKEAMKTKPPSVTCCISMDGKYCAAVKGRPGLAFSAKLPARVKERIHAGMVSSGFPLEKYTEKFGIIVRTNARDLGADPEPLMQEIQELTGRLEELLQNGIHRSCYSVLFRKPAGYLLRLRDMHEGWCGEIVTDEEGIYQKIRDFAAENPDFHLPPVRFYQDERLPLSKLYAVDTKLQEALAKKVWLKSGGYLMIEPTEALTVIDVNTGKALPKKGEQENFLQVNMEAAGEIARQIALRNLSGIIIIDFINMKKEEDRGRLMAYLGSLIRQDTVKTTLVDITALGLVELTRMKTSRPLDEQLGNPHAPNVRHHQ